MRFRLSALIQSFGPPLWIEFCGWRSTSCSRELLVFACVMSSMIHTSCPTRPLHPLEQLHWDYYSPTIHLSVPKTAGWGLSWKLRAMIASLHSLSAPSELPKTRVRGNPALENAQALDAQRNLPNTVDGRNPPKIRMSGWGMTPRPPGCFPLSCGTPADLIGLVQR